MDNISLPAGQPPQLSVIYPSSIRHLSVIYPSSIRHLSVIYPSLAMFNDEGECGTGAVVPWADRLWVVTFTYARHAPHGSSDKLYEITRI